MPDGTNGAAGSMRIKDIDKALPRDEVQELKEAICDALVERTRRVVSGEGEHGKAIYNAMPSRVLVSGFLLPRLSRDGEDEATDINLPTHGLDVRLQADAPGTVRVRPRLSVYARALPSAEELFDTHPELRPKARLNKAADDAVRAAVRELLAAERRRTNAKVSKERHREFQVEAYRRLDIVVPPEDVVPEDGAGLEGREDENVRDEFEDRDLRIPDRHSVEHEVPVKYVRLQVDTPELELTMPYDEEAWKAAATAYSDALGAAVAQAYADWAASPDGQRDAWRPKVVPSTALWNKKNWNDFLASVRRDKADPNRLNPGMRVTLLVQPIRDPSDPDQLTVRLAVENLQAGNDRLENGIFQVSLQVVVPGGALKFMHLERMKRSYQFSGFLALPAMGVTGGVTHAEVGGNHVLTTTWAPRFVLPRMTPNVIPGVPVDYATLSGDELDVSDLGRLPKAMEDWVEQDAAKIRLFEPGEDRNERDERRQRERFEQDLEAWRAEARRIARGVEVLRRGQKAYREKGRNSREAAPYRAWLLMNRAFLGSNPGWRLFQIAFILAHLPTLASRVRGYEDLFDPDFDEESASLLYMTTGGGKSEAFYGLIAYALFLDRLRGKKRGITAMLHYPLRLLTLQQAQRLMRLIARAEVVRRDDGVQGAPFEIGFWVGSGNTPNSTTTGDNGSLNEHVRDIPTWREARGLDEQELRRTNPAYATKADAYNKLTKCPFCGSEGTVLRLFPEYRQRLGIVCTAPSSGEGACWWNEAHEGLGRPEPLPFILVDTDIYRRAPSVILGTVDKLALAGNHPSTINRIAGMFGLARWVDRAHGGDLLLTPGPRALGMMPETAERVAPSYATGVEEFFDPIPSLIVQDEMHLLEESLGTFGGIFETTLFAWFERIAALLGPSRTCAFPGAPGRWRMPHVVGATATASDVARQIANLYQRRAVQFPHPGPKLYRSFYTRLSGFDPMGGAHAARAATAVTPRQEEAAAPWARLYVSLLTNGRPHTSTSIVVLSSYAAGITRLLKDLCSRDPVRQARAAEELLTSLSDNPLRPRHEAAVRRVAEAGRWDILANLVDLHRIHLTYVTHKKGGDQIMSALEREAPKDHAAMGPDYKLDRLEVKLISGGVEAKDIQEVIDRAETPFELGAENLEEALRGVVATSAISHGVDVDMFNAMAFAGMPAKMSEFIQASSRVGRKHVGFSMLLPTPQTRRDRFIVEVHEAFHRFLERMIAPPAIERWADKAVVRTIPSLFQTYMAGVLYQERFVNAPDGAKEGVPFPDSMVTLYREFMGSRRLAMVRGCKEFVEAAVGIKGITAAAPSPEYYRDLVGREIERIVEEIRSNRYGTNLMGFWESAAHTIPRPMTSLRDVDEDGKIYATPIRPGGAVRQDKVAALMSMVRRRGLSRRRRGTAAGAETDQEN